MAKFIKIKCIWIQEKIAKIEQQADKYCFGLIMHLTL